MSERLFKPQDAHKLEDPQRQIWLPVADVVQALAVRPGMRIADVGAGTGYFAIPMAHAVGPGGKVFAVDLQTEMLDLLRQKLRAADAPRNLELVQGEASRTTLASRSVEVLLIANVWHELENHAAALQEAARILAPGGTLALLDWRADLSPPPGPPPDHRLAAEDVLQYLRKNHWTVEPATNLGRYSYFLTATPPHSAGPLLGEN